MATTVINIRNAPKNWHEDSQYVYIGRGGKGQKGTFGNPIVYGAVCVRCGATHSSGGETLACYRGYLWNRLCIDAEFKALIQTLKGKTLVCFCKPAPCHGDILAQYLDTGRL